MTAQAAIFLVYVEGDWSTAAANHMVDFNPGSGVDNHTALGSADAFFSKFLAQTVILTPTVYLPLVVSP